MQLSDKINLGTIKIKLNEMMLQRNALFLLFILSLCHPKRPDNMSSIILAHLR